jgi:hypothetical protein
VRSRLRKLAAIATVVALTFLKIFPFSSQLFGAIAAVAFGAATGDGRVQRWFHPYRGWPRTIAWGIVGGVAVFAVDALLFSIYRCSVWPRPNLTDSLGLLAIYCRVA